MPQPPQRAWVRLPSGRRLDLLSPTAFNVQNWRFVVVRDPELRRQIREAAKLIGESARPVLYVGGGIVKAEAYAELADLVNTVPGNNGMMALMMIVSG